MNATAANSSMIARIITNEVEEFMDRERTTTSQKDLKELERDIERILTSDAKVGKLLLPRF